MDNEKLDISITEELRIEKAREKAKKYIEEYHREVAGRLAEMSDEDVRMAAGVIHDAYQILSGGEAGMR